ncbi:MAG TPA: LppX_LprAFG lipoprotein [Marmoricola sp.]|nr:LppX_LprAFG lipoprotein [Marmoricola sp.]
MHTNRSRTLALVAAGALLFAPLAGCGSTDKTKDSSAKVGNASSSASSSPSAAASTDQPAGLSTEGAAAPGQPLTKDNLVPTMLAAMRDKKTAHMTMQFGSSIGAEADLRYNGDRTDMKMSMDMGSSKAVVIMVDKVLYLQQSAGGKFRKIDASDPAMGSLLSGMSSFGPESSIGAMKGAVKSVEKVGTSTVDGAQVDKYQVTVDSASIAKTLGSGAGAAAGQLPKTVTYDLYVDHDHLMRRIDMTVANQHITMVVSKWGEPVDITAPPASQVVTQ